MLHCNNMKRHKQKLKFLLIRKQKDDFVICIEFEKNKMKNRNIYSVFIQLFETFLEDISNEVYVVSPPLFWAETPSSE